MSLEIITELFSLLKAKILASKGENSKSRIFDLSLVDVKLFILELLIELISIILISPLYFHAIAKYFSFIDINLPSVEVVDKEQFDKNFVSLLIIFFVFDELIFLF